MLLLHTNSKLTFHLMEEEKRELRKKEETFVRSGGCHAKLAKSAGS